MKEKHAQSTWQANGSRTCILRSLQPEGGRYGGSPAPAAARARGLIFLFTTIASFWNFSAPFPAPLPHLRFVFLILVSPPPVPGSESGAGAAPSESAPYDSPSPSQGVAPRAFPGFLSLNNLLSEYSSQRPDCLSHDALRNRSRRAEPTGSPKPKPLTRSRQWPWVPH